MKEFEQGCKRCEQFALPRLMWFNTCTEKSRARSRDDERAVHDRERCQACAAGVCTVDIERELEAFLM
jgi:hypothetical protein